MPNGPNVPGATNTADAACMAALNQLRKPYIFGAGHGIPGGGNPSGFDCSGLVEWAYRTAGLDIGSGSTYTLVLQGTGISTTDRSKWAPGDLIFPDPGHVQLYLGNDTIVEAPHTGAFVQKVTEWATVIYAVRRVTTPGTG